MPSPPDLTWIEIDCVETCRRSQIRSVIDIHGESTVATIGATRWSKRANANGMSTYYRASFADALALAAEVAGGVAAWNRSLDRLPRSAERADLDLDTRAGARSRCSDQYRCCNSQARPNLARADLLQRLPPSRESWIASYPPAFAPPKFDTSRMCRRPEGW